MLRQGFFIFAYGSLLILGAFLSVFWLKVTHKRHGSTPLGSFGEPDRYAVLSFAIHVMAVGMLLNFAGRLYGNVLHGLSNVLVRGEGWVIGAGLWMMMGGSLMLVWLADLEVHPPKFSWLKITLAACLIWLVATVIVLPYVPIVQDRPAFSP